MGKSEGARRHQDGGDEEWQNQAEKDARALGVRWVYRLLTQEEEREDELLEAVSMA